MLQTNPEDQKFIDAIKYLTVGETIEVDDGVLEVEYVFDVPSHFPFHQRIFQPGMILKKQGRNTRIYVDAEKLGIEPKNLVVDGEPAQFDDRQIVDGEVLPAERGDGYEA